jgi:hypothetical protein
VVDDIVALAVIALFYPKAIRVGWLLGALGGLTVVVALRRLGMTSIIASQRWASPCGSPPTSRASTPRSPAWRSGC